jgi:hypothetical protein
VGPASAYQFARDDAHGRKDENGKTIDCGVIAILGLKAAEEIRAAMERLQAASEAKSSSNGAPKGAHNGA